MTKIKTDSETSFFCLLNALFVLSYWKLYLIEISLRKNVHLMNYWYNGDNGDTKNYTEKKEISTAGEVQKNAEEHF